MNVAIDVVVEFVMDFFLTCKSKTLGLIARAHLFTIWTFGKKNKLSLKSSFSPGAIGKF